MVCLFPYKKLNHKKTKDTIKSKPESSYNQPMFRINKFFSYFFFLFLSMDKEIQRNIYKCKIQNVEKKNTKQFAIIRMKMIEKREDIEWLF